MKYLFLNYVLFKKYDKSIFNKFCRILKFKSINYTSLKNKKYAKIEKWTKNILGTLKTYLKVKLY